ncbi:MAG: Hsp33 family molecular chaperone HslO [Bdellovibrionota bacterium]
MSENTKTQQNDPYRIVKFLDAERGVRVAVVNATAAVREMQQIQNAQPLATMMVGRSIVGAALLASQLKDGEVISVYFHGDGPIRTVFAESSFEGGVRGYTPHPELDLPLTPQGLDLKTAIGAGHLTVVRTHPNRTNSQKGTVPIQSGQIGDDIAFYLLQSQQIRSAIAVGVKLSPEGGVVAAGGILIELLPGADANIEVIVEDQFVRTGSISEMFAAGKTPAEIAEDYLPVFNLKEIDHPYSVSYTCKCSKNRLLAAMELFKDEDLKDIVDKKENPIAKCEFCGRQYTLEWSEVKDVLNRRLTGKLH